MASVEDLESLFQKFDTRKHPEGLKISSAFKKASVLIPIFMKDGHWHVLLTLRSKHLSSHADTVSFPGGREDETDKDEVSTALREAKEEIGLNPEDVRVIATLPASIVRPNNVVTPVLGVIPNDFVPDPHDGEVQKVFSLSLNRFLMDDYHCSRKTFSFSDNYKIIVHYFDDYIDGTKITTWGFTATLCIRVAMVILKSSDTREFLVGQQITKDTAFSNDDGFTKNILHKANSRI